MATNPTPLSGEPPIPPGFALESPQPALAQEPPIPPGFRVESPVAPIPSPQNSPEAPSIRAASPTLLQTLREHLFGGPQGETVLGRSFPSLSGARIGDTPTSELPLIRFEDRPPAANAGPVVNAAHGMNQGLDALVGGKNLALMAATGGLGAVGEAAPLLGRAINAGLSTYFGYQMAHGASAAVQAASEAHDAGNDDEAARLLGYGSVQALLAAVSASHAVRSWRGLSDDIADVIDAHNAQAFKLIDADEQHGRGVDLGEHIAGEPQKLYGADGAEYTLQANQASPKGRPNYTVFDSNGKPVYGGIGTDVAEFLRSKGATPPGPDLPAEPPPIVETKATAPEPAMPRGFVAEPVAAEPHESVLTRDAAKVGEALAEPAAVTPPIEPQVAPPPAATPAAPIPLVTPPAEATAPEPAIPAGFHVEPAAPEPPATPPAASAATPEPAIPEGFSAEPSAVAPVAPVTPTPEATPETPAETPAAPAPIAPVPSTKVDATSSAAPAPTGVRSMVPSDILADPARFQYKADTGGKAGVGETLKHLKKFNPNLAGVISVWHDPADGKTYVVNGHHRLELAQRTAAPSINVRYIDAADAQEAYRTGALINIAEGRGTAIDAAKVFRSSQLTPEDLEETHGVSLRDKVASDGMALSHLSSDIFDKVIQGDLPVARAVVIGELLRDHQEQRDALKLLDQAEARGKKPTNEQARELIRFVKGAPKVETQAANLSLFGEDTISKNLALEKAEVSDYIKQQLAKTRKLFQATSTLKSADVLGKTGNVIKTEENARVAEQTAKIQAVYDKLSLSACPIADALDRAAQQLAAGKSPAEVKQHALAEVTESVARTLAALERSAPASSAGSGVEHQGGPRDAGEDERRAAATGSERGSESATVEPPDPPITGRLWGDKRSPKNVREQGSFSQLEKVVLDKLPETVSGAQAFATINNPQNGVKPDEIKWTGVNDWLAEHKGKKLAKDDILDYLRDNEIDVEQVETRDKSYRDHILQGLEDPETYKEILFILKGTGKPHQYNLIRFREKLEDKYSGAFYDSKVWDGLTPEERAEDERLGDLRREEKEAEESTPAYTPPHFGREAKGLLAHARVTSRHDAAGDLVLAVEEIQSDQHQQGRDRGYRENKLPKNGSISWNPETGDGIIYVSDGPSRRFHAAAEDLPAAVGQKHADELRATPAEIGGSHYVVVDQRGKAPDAPLAKTWHEFVLRRLLRYAAEIGAKQLAWTTGAQQAQRYDLSQHVSGVAYDPETEGLFVRRASGADRYWEPVNHADEDSIVPGHKLPDYLGKDLARKLLAQEPRTIDDGGSLTAGGRRLHVVEGKDLQVGGQGMNEFYDQIVPRYLAKYGKKWGAAVGKTVISGPDGWGEISNPEGLPGAGRIEHTLHSISITPAMRESVMEGQPLFGRAPRLPAGQAPAFRRGETTKWHMGRMAFGAKPVTLDPFLDRLTIAHVVNASAMEYIGRRIGLADDDAGLQVGGLHLGPLEAAHLLHNAGVDARTIGNPATLQALAQILRDAIKANKSLTLVTDAPHIGEDRREAFLTEELHHVLQRLLGPMRQFLKADAARIMALPEAQRALAGLEDTKTGPGYQFNKNDNLAALEICERLMRADRYSYQDLTLSKTERDSLAQEIVRALEQVYGPTRAKDLTGRLRAAIHQSAPHTGIPGRLAREGDDSDLPAHESSRTRIGETGRQRRIAPGNDDAERQDSLGTSRRVQDSLFGAASDETVAAGAARDRDQLQGERLTAQLNAPLTREEQLKKLKRSKDQPQKDLFGENEEPPQGSFTLGSGFGALQPYIDKFIANKVVPTAKQAGEVMAFAKDDVLKVLAPAARGVAAAEANLIVRKNASELARSTDRAEAALRVAGKFFDKQTPAQNYAFIDDVENGRPQATPALDAIAATLRTILDQRRAAVQALGKGKLSSFIENYFPHIWEKPAAAREAFMNYAKRPLEGSKSFLKKRSIETIADGLALGLKPLSDNPVELVLLKVREMDKYLMAHHILADLKQKGILKFVDARDFAPYGWKKIDDAAATVYGPGEIPISEYANKGLQDGMQRVLDTLNIAHERKMQLRGGALGLSRKGGGVQTKFGTDEQTLAHEIGHQIEDMFPFVRQMMKHPDKKTRIRLKEELRALADLRYETAKPSNYYKQYVRKADEKAAAVVQAYVAARPKFRQVAPLVLSEFEGLINRHPAELGGLRTIQASLEHHPMAGQVDAGGVVVKGHWQAPEPAARIVNNFLSPGLRDRSILFRGFLGAGNLLNQAQLGFSAFHLGFTTIDVAVSKLALAIYQMAHGDVVKGLKSAALVPASPVTNLMRGHQMLKEWNAPGTQSAIIGELVDAAVAAGGRAKMDSFYQTNVTKNMLAAFRAQKWFMGAIRLPFAAVEQAARPIMEWIVPRQKMGVFADLAQYELEKLGTNASDPDVQAALARAWDSVDNRLGQLVYDNLAWHKATKDLAMVSVRSVGWNLGTIREVGGGAADIPKLFKPEGMTTRTAYLIALHLLAGLAGAVAYYLAHGHMPHKLKDYYFPTDAQGHRWSLPTYIKDEYEWTHDPERTAAGKVHPLIQMLVEMIANKDFFDHQIANPHHSLVKRAEEEAAFIAKQYVSLGLRPNQRKGHVVTPEERALGFVGVKPAPKSLDQLGR